MGPLHILMFIIVYWHHPVGDKGPWQMLIVSRSWSTYTFVCPACWNVFTLAKSVKVQKVQQMLMVKPPTPLCVKFYDILHNKATVTCYCYRGLVCPVLVPGELQLVGWWRAEWRAARRGSGWSDRPRGEKGGWRREGDSGRERGRGTASRQGQERGIMEAAEYRVKGEDALIQPFKHAGSSDNLN